VLRIARSDLIERGTTVHRKLDEGMPRMAGDHVQLQQVLLNLIINAEAAMAENPAKARDLTIETKRGEGTVRVSVSDTGCGLPSDVERIFEPFYTTKKEGLGLGLPICRSIVSAHNGRLWAEPNMAGRGASVHLELPISLGGAS
jgi:two-component system, LuxR family, sensor kinase FixL